MRSLDDGAQGQNLHQASRRWFLFALGIAYCPVLEALAEELAQCYRMEHKQHPTYVHMKLAISARLQLLRLI
jgi:hypothetical protein